MPVRLTEDFVNRMPVGQWERDTEVKGLIVTRNSKGIRYKFQMDLRGRTIRKTFDVVSLKEARAAARTLKNQVSAGVDPRLPKSNRAGPETWTLREALERYAEKPGLKEGTRKGIRDSYRYLEPLLGRRLANLDKDDCREVHAAILSPAVANTTFRYVRAAWNWAEKFDNDDALGKNPTRGVIWHPAKARPAVAFDLADWSRRIAVVSVPRQQFHILCLLTGVRVGTLKKAEWSMFEGDRFRFPDSVMKSGRDFVLPLSTQAIAVVESIPRLDRRWIFPAASKTGHMVEHYQPELVANGVLLSAHQARKNFRTMAEVCGVPEAHAGALLDHAQVGLNRNYVSITALFDELQTAAQKINDELFRRGLSLPSSVFGRIKEIS